MRKLKKLNQFAADHGVPTFGFVLEPKGKVRFCVEKGGVILHEFTLGPREVAAMKMALDGSASAGVILWPQVESGEPNDNPCPGT